MGLRGPVVFVRTLPDGSGRFKIVERSVSLYEVWVQRRCLDTGADGEPLASYSDLREGAHFAASLAKAVQIGEESLRALTPESIPEEEDH
jgi:hypothetical protein